MQLIELPSCEALQVRLERGGEPLLVPMVKDAIRSVAIELRRIDVDLEFLGLQEPTASAGEAGERPER